jgi:hypothetical protein
VSSVSPAAVLVDADGNQVGVLLDGTVYRLQVSAVVSADSVKVLETADLLEGILNELRCIHALLEAMADEDIREKDVNHDH